MHRLLQRILCVTGRHRANRRTVWHDGLDFRSRCHGCERLMLRDLAGQWRLFATLDNRADRKPHPHYHG